MKELLKIIKCLLKPINLLFIVNFKVHRLRNINNFLYIFIKKDDFNVYLL